MKIVACFGSGASYSQQFSIWPERLKMVRRPGRKTGRAMVTKAVGLLF